MKRFNKGIQDRRERKVLAGAGAAARVTANGYFNYSARIRVGPHGNIKRFEKEKKSILSGNLEIDQYYFGTVKVDLEKACNISVDIKEYFGSFYDNLIEAVKDKLSYEKEDELTIMTILKTMENEGFIVEIYSEDNEFSISERIGSYMHLPPLREGEFLLGDTFDFGAWVTIYVGRRKIELETEVEITFGIGFSVKQGLVDLWDAAFFFEVNDDLIKDIIQSSDYLMEKYDINKQEDIDAAYEDPEIQDIITQWHQDEIDFALQELK